MEKFSDISYVRPNLEQMAEKIKDYQRKLAGATSYSQARDFFLEHKEEGKKTATMMSVASIRNTVNTADPFYAGEMTYFHEQMPQIHLLEMEADQTLLQSAYVEEFRDEFGANFIRDLEISQKLASEAIIPQMIEEGKLTQEYGRISASCTTTFLGETCNFSKLLKHMQNTDRTIRKEAFRAWADLYQQTAPKLDQLYDQLIAVRVEMAEKLGFENYTEFAYLRRGRYDYRAEDVAAFRKQVQTTIVPIASRLYQEQKERLGLEQLAFYDESLHFPEGNAVPIGNKDQMVEQAGEMYRKLSPETGKFFDFMMEHELFDLETKPGKRVGGYCTFLQSENAPFIFANFNQTSTDAGVLTHEAGHAFEAFIAARKMLIPDLIWSTSEINEIHSMSMEFFTYPYMEGFFGEKADQYRQAHLADAVCKIPYMAAVDEFQHRIYAEPSMTAEQRREVWHELEAVYLPWRRYDHHAFMEAGGFWMQKQHIFLYPFYYIDYALAQLGAFEFYGRMKQNQKEAWSDYVRLCQTGGSKSYFELLQVANLSNPFQEGTIEKIMNQISWE